MVIGDCGSGRGAGDRHEPPETARWLTKQSNDRASASLPGTRPERFSCRSDGFSGLGDLATEVCKVIAVGSGPPRRPVSRASMAAISSVESSKSKRLKFSLIRLGLVDFGITERPCWRPQRSITWAGVFSWVLAILFVLVGLHSTASSTAFPCSRLGRSSATRQLSPVWSSPCDWPGSSPCHTWSSRSTDERAKATAAWARADDSSPRGQAPALDVPPRPSVQPAQVQGPPPRDRAAALVARRAGHASPAPRPATTPPGC